jgi:diamine N-acetyltransferase
MRSSARRATLPWSWSTVLPVVVLRPIDDSNRGAVEALDVSPQQQQFVSNAASSIREAEREPGGRALYWAVYADQTPIGFVMISDEVAGPGYFPQYLWKLFIDERFQGRGYGTATLDLIADYFRRRPEVTIMRTSCGQGEGSPLGFYERYGFEQTGDIVFDNEILLEYKLR